LAAGGEVRLNAEAVEAVGFELGLRVVRIEHLIGIGGEERVAIDEEKGGGGEGLEILGVGEGDGFSESSEETGVLALADEDFAEDFAEVAGGGYGVAGEEVLFCVHRTLPLMRRRVRSVGLRLFFIGRGGLGLEFYDAAFVMLEFRKPCRV
jgi:hypothetical protein